MKIAITCKGGTEKTTIAAHLGKILSEMNAVGKILLIDADATKNLSTLLGYENITPVNKIKDVVEGRARLENGLVNLKPDVVFVDGNRCLEEVHKDILNVLEI